MGASVLMRGGIENNSCVERGDCEKIHVVGRRGWLFFVPIVEREISIRKVRVRGPGSTLACDFLSF